MKSGVITHHDKDSRSDKWAACVTWRSHVSLAKAEWDMEEEWRGHVWTSDFSLSFCLRGLGKRGGCVCVCGRGRHWMRENNSGSSSNWNLRSSKSVFHVCMQLLPKGRTHLLLLSLHCHYCHWTNPPPPLLRSTQKPHTSGDCHPEYRAPPLLDHWPLCTLSTKWHQRFQTLRAREISCILQRSCQKLNLWNICQSDLCRCILHCLSTQSLI